MFTRTALFIAADLVFVALLVLMARIYFYGLRLAQGVLYAISAVATAGLFVFVFAMASDNMTAWLGPAALSLVLMIAAFLAPSSVATKALAPNGNDSPRTQDKDDESSSRLAIMEPPATAIEPPTEPPLDYRHFVLDRDTNMFLHQPNGSQTTACYVSWLSAPGSAQLTLDDLVNRAENHICYLTEAHTQVIQAVA